MLVANIVLKLSKDQTVTRTNVTPAEAAYYVAEHEKNSGGGAVTVVGEPEEIERADEDEVARLNGFLSTKKLKALYPNAMAKLPETFEQAIKFGKSITLPQGKLIEFDASK